MEHEFTLGMSLFGAAWLGALHVLEPAHGRSIFHAFLVGSTGKWRNVLLFGIAVMITHTAIALLIAIGFGLFGETLAKHGLAPLAKLAGALLTLYIGFRMLRHGQQHVHSHGHAHDHNAECSPTEMKAPAQWSPIGLGLAGGLIPCYGSIALIGPQVGRGAFFTSVLPVFAFGLGLGITLMIAGAAALKTKQTTISSWTRSRLGHWSDYFAAGIVFLFGIYSICMAVLEFIHGAH